MRINKQDNGQNKGRKFVACACFFFLFAGSALANTSYNLGGTPTKVQIQVMDLKKDAELIGMKKSRIEEALRAALLKNKIAVDAENGLPAIVIKVTTIDVAPRLASHITLELKELVRIARHSSNITYATTWSRATMIASEPTKHEALVLKAVQDLVDIFVKESLQ